MEIRIQRDHVMAVLQSALERPPEERQAYVRNACSDNESFYHEVTDALDWEQRMGSFLKQPLLDFTFLVRPFEIGQVLADRFEILREIGEGGMGVVYEAFDRRLQQNIAIKAAKPGFQRLLSPELKAALKVRHRNICVLNEIHSAETEYGEIDFLTMELLEGETLAAYLKKVGKLEHEEALDIACQICAGLAEAHYSGILHRDLKSGNVILAKNEDGSRRVVITDFGLAGGQPLPADEMAGTPAYMAPELWRGEQQSKASDIYALGVMLYELVTGSRPYEREEEAKLAKLSTLTARENSAVGDLPRVSLLASADPWPHGDQAPAPPSEWVKGLDARWDRVVTRCLQISPAERPHDAGEVLTALRHEPINKAPFAVAALVLAAIVAVVGLVRPLRQAVMDYIWPPNVRLAVLPYDGPQDLAAVGNGAVQDAADRAQHLSSERKWPLNKLSRTVAIIPPARIAALHVTSPQQARDLLHATHALQLTLHRDNGSIVGDVTVVDLSANLPVKQLTLEYPERDVGAISKALTHFVAMAFRLHEPRSEDQLSAAATPAYLNGIYFINRDVHSFDEAIAQFQQAARVDPNSALPPAGMATALVQKYGSTQQKTYLEQAQAFVRMAQSRNADSVTVLLAAGHVAEASHQWNKALHDYQRIEELEPRNVDVQHRLSVVYERLEEPEEALAALRKAQMLDPQYYRSYQLLGEFYSRQGRYQEAAEQFEKTVALAPGFFDGYSSLGAMLIELGRFPEAEDALRKSLSIRETFQALNNLGALMSFQKRYGEAVDYQKRALVYRPNSPTAMMNVADNLRWAGRTSEATSYYMRGGEQSLGDITADPKDAEVRAMYAYFCARLGDRRRAEQEIKEAINSAPGNSEVLRFAVKTYEVLGERGLALEASRGMTLAQLKDLTREPEDLADFSQDPRFIQQMIDKGGQ